MAANNRIFYACQAVAVCKTGHTPAAGLGANARFAKGVQSVGITSNFTLDQAFELGQIEIYQNSEEVADIEVTMEKVIDGEHFLYGLAGGNSVKTNMVTASNSRSDIYLGIYSDGITSTDGAAVGSVVMCSGMYISSVSYTYPSDGNATESITLVGNDKFWNDFTKATLPDDPTTSYGATPSTGMDGSDTPVSGVMRRVNFDVANSTIPAAVKMAKVATGTRSDGQHLSSVSCSADFGRESILELGAFGPYFRYASFPIEVTSEFEVTSVSGDWINVSGNAENLGAGEQITLKDSAGTIINLGSKNKLSSVSYSGGDTGGGNATVTYSYSTFNDLKVDGGGTYW